MKILMSYNGLIHLRCVEGLLFQHKEILMLTAQKNSKFMEEV